MDVRLIENPAEVAEFAGQFFRRDPFTSSVIATQVESMLLMPPPSSEAIWVVASEDGVVVGVAMHTPPLSGFLTRMEPKVAVAIAELLAGGRDLPGVSGEVTAVARFAETWERLTGSVSRRRTAMRMYVLGELAIPVGVPGTFRRADEADVDLVALWFEAFHSEAQPTAPTVDPRQVAERRIHQRGLWFWCDPKPVSLAGVNPPAAGVARVGPVYTPPALRRRGYGAAVTAAASQAAADEGAEHVALYTDLANPTSNSIYQALGYAPHHDAEERDFLR